jgi:hypothetical protein
VATLTDYRQGDRYRRPRLRLGLIANQTAPLLPSGRSKLGRLWRGLQQQTSPKKTTVPSQLQGRSGTKRYRARSVQLSQVGQRG